MQKFIISITILCSFILLLGCQEQSQEGPFNKISDKQYEILNENIILNFDTPVEINNNSLRFGPSSHIPESPTDKEYTRPAFVLRVIPKSDFDEIYDNYSNIEVASDPILETINNFEVATWIIADLCTYNYYEIIGENSNIQLYDQSCDDIDTPTYFRNFINDIEQL